MKKEKTTIIDCENVADVIYPNNKTTGAVKFINCEYVTGIEFDVALKVTNIDVSNLLNLKYLNIQRTGIKRIDNITSTCMVYCNWK